MRVVRRTETEPGAYADEEEELHDVVRVAREALSQLRPLGRDPDRARVQMTHAHENASQRHEGGRREAELVASE